MKFLEALACGAVGALAYHVYKTNQTKSVTTKPDAPGGAITGGLKNYGSDKSGETWGGIKLDEQPTEPFIIQIENPEDLDTKLPKSGIWAGHDGGNIFSVAFLDKIYISSEGQTVQWTKDTWKSRMIDAQEHGGGPFILVGPFGTQDLSYKYIQAGYEKFKKYVPKSKSSQQSYVKADQTVG